nr:LysR substrate-binding domain-containing protein [Micrococcus sp. TA1]
MTVPLPFTLRQLEVFDAVVRAGSLSAAARELTTAQSSVSAAVDELERQIGQHLLVRRRAHGVWPTAAGRQLHREARAILRAADEAGRVLQERDGHLRGPLTVGIYQTLAPYILPTILGDFAAEHPGVELSFEEVRHADLLAGLTAGTIDVGFTYLLETPEGISHQPVLTRPTHVLLPAGHRLAGRQELTKADIAEEPLILLGDAPSMLNTRRVLELTENDPRIAWVTSSLPLTRALVGKGLGISVLVQPDASPWTVDGHEVVEIPLVDAERVTVYMTWLAPAERRRPPRRVTELVNFLHASLEPRIQAIATRREAATTLLRADAAPTEPEDVA